MSFKSILPAKVPNKRTLCFSHALTFYIMHLCCAVTEDTMRSLMANPQQHGDTGRLMSQIEHFNMVCQSART